MRIRVTVFKQKGRPHLVAEWRDPLTGKLKRKSTGEKQRREAERYAARLERELNEGRLAEYRTTWAEFRMRYESEVASFRAESTQASVSRAFNVVESKISPRFLRSVTAGELSRVSAVLKEEGKAEATIASILRHLKAALRWAARLKLIPEVPHVTMPHKAGQKAGGRAITLEELERLEAAFPDVLAAQSRSKSKKGKPAVSEETVRSWRKFVRGLWWSGLRLHEACRLHWEDDRYIIVELGGKRPMFRIQAEANKSRKDEKFPMAREFAEILMEIPQEQRVGFVFNPLTATGQRADVFRASRVIAAAGKKAGVVVDRNAKGEAVYASAHDLRRSFGTRWAKRVLPPVLKALMRHTSIQTTMTFYVDQSAEQAADTAWKAAEGVPAAERPIISPITDVSESRSN